MKKVICLALAGSAMLVAGCRYDVAAPTILVADGENVEIVRSMSAYRDMSVYDGLADTADLYACVAAPAGWGAPVSVTVSRTEEGAPVAGAPAELPTLVAAMQAAYPLAGYSWYCYKESGVAYASLDSGQISVEFTANTERALVYSTMSTGSAVTDSRANLDNLAVQDVVRGTAYPENSWEPVTLDVSSQEDHSYDRRYRVIGEYQGRKVILFTGSVADVDAPSLLYFLSSSAEVDVERLEEYAFVDVLARHDRMVAVVRDPATGDSYIGVRTPASDEWGFTPYEGAGIPVLDTDNLSGGYVLTEILNGDEAIYYSMDGMSWTPGSATGLDSHLTYSSTTNVEVVTGFSDVGYSQARVRVGGAGAWMPVLENWVVDIVQSEKNALYAVISEPPDTEIPYDASGDVMHLLRSTDGLTWTKVLGDTSLDRRLGILSYGDKMLLVFGKRIYSSDSNGIVWTEMDLSGQIPFLAREDVHISLSSFAVSDQGGALNIAIENTPGDFNDELPEGEFLNGWNAYVLVRTSDLETFEVVGGGAIKPINLDGKLHAIGYDRTGLQLFRMTGSASAGSGAGGGTGSNATAASSGGGGGGAFVLLPLLWLLRVRRG